MAIPTKLRDALLRIKTTERRALPFRIRTCYENPNKIVRDAIKNAKTAWSIALRASLALQEHPEYEPVITHALIAIECLCKKVKAVYDIYHAGKPTITTFGHLTNGNRRAYRANESYMSADATATVALEIYEAERDIFKEFRDRNP